MADAGCETCQARDFAANGSLIPVWENPEDYERGRPPDYIGCTDCNTMEPYVEEHE